MTYRFILTRQFVEDARSGDISRAYDAWLKGCGVFNSRAGRVTQHENHNLTALVFEATFDSRAWTGAGQPLVTVPRMDRWR